MKPFGSIIARYIFRQAAGALMLILLSLTAVTWIALALRQLNVVTSQGQDTLVFLKMTLLALPNLMALIAPIALLIAAIHTLNRLNGDSELIVMAASGSTVWRIARPLIVLGLITAGAITLVNHFVIPWCLRELREIIVQVRTDLIGQVVQPGRFTPADENLTFHIRERTFEGELLGIVIHNARKGEEVTTHLAERGRIVKGDGVAYLLLEAGHTLRRASVGPDAQKPPELLVWESYPVDLARFEKKGDESGLRPRERYSGELVRPDPKDAIYVANPGQFRSELHERFASPLYPLAFVMIAAAFVGQAQTTRQNRAQSVVAAFVIAAGCRIGGLAATNLLTLKASAIGLVYGIPAGAIVIGAFLAWFQMRPRRLRLPFRGRTPAGPGVNDPGPRAAAVAGVRP